MRKIPSRYAQRGVTLIDTLVAIAIITVAMTGSTGIYFASIRISGQVAENTVAENLARKGIEDVRSKGFEWCTTAASTNPCDGSITTLYDVDGRVVTTSSRYTVVTTVTSSSFTSGVPSDASLRTVQVQVKRTSDGVVLETTKAYLTWGGV